ncbi:unnamed protein product [Rhizoctonia solani]|uniref:Uncharacterized protein n=1 Tax=Rhizoctonia solani TaxID=456999 RepID=A0A8H2WH07_9AGAM|nr:unnamed protein product [Rhizoctonia solani]
MGASANKVYVFPLLALQIAKVCAVPASGQLGTWGGTQTRNIVQRFEPNTGDRFSNLLFGTKECNTAMMRAEAAVEQLLYSGSVYAVKLGVQAKHDLSSVTMLDRLGPSFLFGMKNERTVESTWAEMADSYPRWLALEVEYTIQYYYPNPVSLHTDLVPADADCLLPLYPHDDMQNGQIEPSRPSTIYFHPFSSQCPLFFEYRLDRIVLDKYLSRYNIPLDIDINHAFGFIHAGDVPRHEPLRVAFDIMSRGRDESWRLNEEEFDAFDMGTTELGIEDEFKEVSKEEQHELEQEIEELGKGLEELELDMSNDTDAEESPLICAVIEKVTPRKIQKMDKQSKIKRPQNKLQILKEKQAAAKQSTP